MPSNSFNIGNGQKSSLVHLLHITSILLALKLSLLVAEKSEFLHFSIKVIPCIWVPSLQPSWFCDIQIEKGKPELHIVLSQL